jgi:riboflavin kinase/FMN adenylyltransferase
LSRFDGTRFIRRVLDEAMGVRHVVIGAGYRFGRDRSGDVPLLRSEGAVLGFGVDEVGAFECDGRRVSSTAIREALGAGRLDEARRLLGRDYRMTGKVIQGKRLGRTLGYATANMRLHRKVTPLAGIFAVRVSGVDGGARDGVASLGTRPTVGGGEVLLEAHVFDFDGDLYGRNLAVDFVAKLRDEAHFASLDALVVQMHDDARRAREILAMRAAERLASGMD